jgi:hypothetical protein
VEDLSLTTRRASPGHLFILVIMFLCCCSFFFFPLLLPSSFLLDVGDESGTPPSGCP